MQTPHSAIPAMVHGRNDMMLLYKDVFWYGDQPGYAN